MVGNIYKMLIILFGLEIIMKFIFFGVLMNIINLIKDIKV